MQKKYMLKKNKEFRYVHSRGTSVSNSKLVLITVRNRQGFRIGFSVSKKLGNAVKRNHIKRLLRECATKLMPLAVQNKSYLFIARLPAASADYHELYSAMEELFRASSCKAS